MQCFCDWLVQLSIISSRFIHVIAYCRISFIFKGWIVFHVLFMCHIFCLFICQRTFRLSLLFGYCEQFAYGHRSLNSSESLISILSYKSLEVRLLDHIVVLILWGIFILFSIALTLFCVSTNSEQGSNVSISLSTFVIFCFLDNRHPDRCEVIFVDKISVSIIHFFVKWLLDLSLGDK